jgi:hypothetical protein
MNRPRRNPYPTVAPEAAPENAPAPADCLPDDSLGAMPADTLRIFDRACKLVSARGRGLSLSELGTAHALARELSAPEPDAARAETLRLGLGLDTEALRSLVQEVADDADRVARMARVFPWTGSAL